MVTVSFRVYWLKSIVLVKNGWRVLKVVKKYITFKTVTGVFFLRCFRNWNWNYLYNGFLFVLKKTNVVVYHTVMQIQTKSYLFLRNIWMQLLNKHEKSSIGFYSTVQDLGMVKRVLWGSFHWSARHCPLDPLWVLPHFKWCTPLIEFLLTRLLFCP